LSGFRTDSTNAREAINERAAPGSAGWRSLPNANKQKEKEKEKEKEEGRRRSYCLVPTWA
jgi:hypothetical protein